MSTFSEVVSKGYELDFEDTFDGPELDRTHWSPYYLPHWGSRAQAAARFDLDGQLRFRIDEGQPAWCPEYNGELRVSCFQTGSFSGPVGSPIGQSLFRDDLIVREEQENAQLYLPHFGAFAMRAKVSDDPKAMGALWMIGYEDSPDRSGEICIAEIFGSEVTPDSALVGMGVHPFGDSALTDEWAKVPVAIDAREFHEYAAEWLPDRVHFFVDDKLVKTVHQSPQYPMQFQLGVFEFHDPEADDHGPYPKEFTLDWFRSYRPRS